MGTIHFGERYDIKWLPATFAAPRGAAGRLTLPFSSPPTSCLLVPPATSQLTTIALLKTGGNNRQLLSLSEQGGRSAPKEPWASNSGFPETPVGASEILKNSKFSRHV